MRFVQFFATIPGRIRAHLREARKLSLQKWLYLQITKGKLPIVVEIAKGANNRELERLERERIKFHTDNGIILLNKTSGNDSLLDDVVVKRLPQPYIYQEIALCRHPSLYHCKTYEQRS